MPVILELRVGEYLPADVLNIANGVREENKDYPELVIRRKVRDALDAAKSRRGELANGGLQALEEELLSAV
jgi:hypothetical protein